MRLNEIQNNGLMESPQKTWPTTFGLENAEVNISQAEMFLSGKKCRLVDDQLKLYKCGNKYAIITRDAGQYQKPKIRYIVQYEKHKISLLQHDAIQQVVVWRQFGYTGIAAKIFYEYLFKETGCVITDYQQTDDGQKFWMDRIIVAFRRGFNVYFIDVLDPNRVIKQIKNDTELDNIVDIAWGDGQRYQEKRIIITDFPIAETGDFDKYFKKWSKK